VTELYHTPLLDELDEVESAIRGSQDPVDFARYGRKALRAYYLMGQNQVRISFYIGVAAMIFGFAFLPAGLLLQALDTAKFPYLRADPNINLVTVGGGLIIEFVAATFLWIYRATIEQQANYYRRQMLVHNALISVAIANRMHGEGAAALRGIVEAMISEDRESRLLRLPKIRVAAEARGAAAPDEVEDAGARAKGASTKLNAPRGNS